MRVLITGGAGFIGSHLAEALLAEGHAVTALDDLSTGRRANVAALVEHPELPAGGGLGARSRRIASAWSPGPTSSCTWRRRSA